MSADLKRNALWWTLLLFLLASSVGCFNFREVWVTANTYTTNAIATYTIYYDRTITNGFTSTAFATSPLTNSSTVTVVFPLQYNLAAAAASLICSYQINSIGPFTTTSCSLLSNQITLSNIFTASTVVANFTLIVANVPNPFPAGKTSTFSGTIGIDVAVANNVKSLVTITPATSICSFTFSPALVYSTANMVFSITLTNQFPAGGTIIIQFPLTKLWSLQLDPTRLMSITTSMGCMSQSSNVNSAVQCTGSPSFSVVTVSNVASIALAAGTTLSFSINNFISPPTNQPADAITVTTYAGTSAIDTCNAYITGLLPLTIPSSQFFITELNDEPMVVNQQYTIKFDITTLTIISQADSIVITFPPGTSINNFANADIGGTVSFNQATSTYYSQILTLNLAGGTGIVGAGQIFITISNFVPPPSTLTTGDFQLKIVSNNYPRMISYKSIQAVTATLTGTATMAVTTVNALSTYAFSITIKNPLTSAGFIVLTFPSILTISNSTSALAAGSAMATTPTCNYNPSSNSLTITNINGTTGNIPAQTFTLTISGIKNPPSTTTTPAFTLTTYYNSNAGAAVDSGSIHGVTATPGSIDFSKFVISSSSSITSDTTVTYFFSFLVQNPIPIGGSVAIHFFNAITFDLSIANNNCQLMVNSASPASTPCTATLGSTSYIFTFSNPFPSSPAIAGTNLTFSIHNAATNPPTTQPVGPFSVFTFFSDGSNIAHATNVSTFNGITTPSAFTSNLISKTSNKNGQIGSFTLTLSQTAALEAAAVIRVVFPSSLLPQVTSSCSITYVSTTTGVACGLIASTNTFRVVSLPSSIAAGTAFSITFTNIRNALSFAPISGFTVTTKTAVNDLFFYSSSSSTNSVSNTIPMQFQSITYQYSPQQLNTAVTLQVSFQLSQYSLMPTSLQISIDTYFTATNLTCSAFKDFAATCISLTTNSLRITGSFNSSVMGFTVSGFTSPATPPSTASFSTLNSLDAAGFKIDESATNISFSLACTLPCQTCSSGNTSSCLTCYSSTAVTPSIFYHSASKNCYVTCPVTTYNNNITLLCAPCDSNCLTCFASPTFCTGCVSNSTWPFLNVTPIAQICVSACSSGMYGSNSTNPAMCVNCGTPCATCTSATTCLSCLTGFFFLNGTICTTNCTPLVTIANEATKVCDPCQSPCRTCVGSITKCTSCSDPKVFYNGTCQASCPPGNTLANFNGVCTPCTPTCQTCSTSIYICLSCFLNSSAAYLVNSSCVGNCPIYYYNDSSTGTCYSCALSGQNCINCSAINVCLSCDVPYVLYLKKCQMTIPPGYINISGVATACTGDCATCSNVVNNCTSCMNLSLQGNLCVSSCSVGTITVLQKCVPCTSPCLTCSTSQSTCTACIPTLSPSMYLNGITCQANCPPTFYNNNVNYVCTPCTNNCSLCSSATICSSCTNNTFLLTNTCLVSCPSGYVGISALCQACTNNCKTCTGGTNICLTCVTGTYYLSSAQSCVTACPLGLFLDALTQSCVGCSVSCLTCSGSASTCTACNSTLLLNGQCLANCPSQMFPQAGTCVSCPTNCSTCTSASSCTSCVGANYLYNSQCVSSCPQTSARVLNGACAPCSTQNCFSCTSANVCINCNSGFLFLNAICLKDCPTGYNTNGTHCVNVLEQSLTSSPPDKSFPVPFTIAGLVLAIACLMSRLQFPQTYLSGAIYSLVSILEWGALWYFIYLYYLQWMSEPVALFIALGAMAFLYIMNITACLAQSIFLCYQKEYVAWAGESKCHRCFYWLTTLLSFIANHKFKNILFCKLFTFKVFSARLDRVEHFRIFNIFSLLSLIHSGGAIFAAGIALTKVNSKSQLFHECIDVIVLTGLNAILAFFNTHKDKDFFEETTPDGYSLHKKNNLMEEHLVAHKANGLGEDGEIQQGFMNDYNHALTSKQAPKFNKDLEVCGGYSDGSLADLTEKQPSQKSYEEVSVQALDMLDTAKHNITAKTNIAPAVKPTYQEISIQADSLIHQQQQKAVDFSAVPKQSFEQDSSSFTTYFQKVDRSVQGNLDRGVNFAAQVGAVQEDKSLQNDGRLGDAVDYSVQKSESIRMVDQSMQYSRGQPRDASFQFSRVQQLDQSINVSHNNQISEISQQDEEVQMEPDAQSVGIQPTVQYQDQAIQPDLEYRDISVQPSLQPSANEMAIQYEPMQQVHYDELQQELRQSHTASNVLFQTEEQEPEAADRQLAEEQVEELQLRNEDMRSYQDQLEERIRNKEKELQEIRRKVDFRQRSNAAKREELANNPIEEQDIDLHGITYVQQRPAVSQPQRMPTKSADRPSSSGSSQLVEEIQVKREPILGIESKQMPKESIKDRPKQTKLLNASQSSASNPLNQTLQQIKVFKEPKQAGTMKSYNQPSFKKQSERLVSYKQQSERSPSFQQRQQTIEQFKAEEVPVSDRSERQKTREEIRLQDVRPTRGQIEGIQTRSQYARVRPPQKKQIQYKEYDNQLLSEDSEQQQNNIFIRNDDPTPKKNEKDRQQQPQAVASPISERKREEAIHNIEIMDMGSVQLQTGSQAQLDYQPSNTSSHNYSNHLEDRQQPQISIPKSPARFQQIEQGEVYREEEKSQATRKNHYTPQRKNVVVDVTEIDQSLRGEDDYIQLEEASQSDQQPAGISNPYQAKPNFRNRQQKNSRSDLSGTIEEIPQHQLAFDDKKTISNAAEVQRATRPQVSKQQLTNIFANSLPANQRPKKNNLPIEQSEQFRINRLYPNQAPQSNMPKTSRNEEVLPRGNLPRTSTLAQAGRAQLAEDALAQKKHSQRSPLKVAGRQWEAQHEDKFVSEEEEFAPVSNRKNLVRQPAQTHKFASHLVLPQETDKQNTSFQLPRRDALGGKNDTSFQQPRREAPMSGKAREPRQLQEIEVHFQADQLSRDLSITDKNRSPQRPNAYGRQSSRQQSSAVEEQEGVDYRKMMMLGQMQERPKNTDLQQYYRKQSKQKRRKSNSKLDRSTEKIYMQKLDKKR